LKPFNIKGTIASQRIGPIVKNELNRKKMINTARTTEYQEPYPELLFKLPEVKEPPRLMNMNKKREIIEKYSASDIQKQEEEDALYVMDFI